MKKTPVNWKRCFERRLFWFFVFPVVVAGCAAGQSQYLDSQFTGRIYVLDVENEALARSQEGQLIPIAELPRSRTYFVLEDRDLEQLIFVLERRCGAVD